MTPSAAGKGDDPRPLSVSYEEYAANWDLAFGRKPVDPALSGMAALDELTRLSQEMGLYDVKVDILTK